jgi:hypothetical protein
MIYAREPGRFSASSSTNNVTLTPEDSKELLSGCARLLAPVSVHAVPHPGMASSGGDSIESSPPSPLVAAE